MARFSKFKRSGTVSEAFSEFISVKRSAGLKEKTLTTYEWHFEAVSRFLDLDQPVEDLSSRDLRAAVSALSRQGFSPNSIRSYTATLHSFTSWLHQEGLSDAQIGLYKGSETVPTTYSRPELDRLLKRPNRRCTFCEFRNWTIVNLLVNNGVRASTVRAMEVQDVDLIGRAIRLRHTKNRKAQTIPLSPEMAAIMAEYCRFRRGDPDDPLFPAIDGGPMTESCLHNAIRYYNKSRGVKNTSIHAFRHTFARIYLVECNGNALKLQRLLGHSTLDMTKKYVRIYDSDLIDDFQHDSPLSAIKKGLQTTQGSSGRPEALPRKRRYSQ